MFSDDDIIRGLSDYVNRLERRIAELETEVASFYARPNSKWFAFDDCTKKLKPFEAPPCNSERNAQ